MSKEHSASRKETTLLKWISHFSVFTSKFLLTSWLGTTLEPTIFFTKLLWQFNDLSRSEVGKSLFWLYCYNVDQAVSAHILLTNCLSTGASKWHLQQSLFHMGILWIRWHAYVSEQVKKSVNQIKRINNLQRIIWHSTKPS